MTTYTVEEGVPIPASDKVHLRQGQEKSPLRQTLEGLAPGQSVLLDSHDDYRKAMAVTTHAWERKFATRKVIGQGWRVWRVS